MGIRRRPPLLMASNDMYPSARLSYGSQLSIPLPHKPAWPHLPLGHGRRSSWERQVSLAKNIRLPRLQELDEPLSPTVAISAYEGMSLRSRMDAIDKFRIDRMNHSPHTRRFESTKLASGRKPRKPQTRSRCNVKYTTEQIDFIDYFRVDHQLSWKDVEANYAATFPEDAAKGYKRGPQGLQGVYYRKNKQTPATDQSGHLLFDNNNNLETLQSAVREQGMRQKPIGLLQMHPERAIKYAWVTDEHKIQYEEIGRARQEQLDVANKRKWKTQAFVVSRV